MGFSPAELLERPAVMMVGGWVAGLLIGFVSPYTSALAIAALAVLMVASLCELELRGFAAVTRPALLAFPASYVCLAGSLLLLGAVLPSEFRPGWVLMAAVPSAISVVPFTSVLGGDARLSLAATLMLYLAALGLTPLLTLWLAAEPVAVAPLVQTLLLLVLLPLIVSRGVRRLRLPRRGLLLLRNLAFFALTFLIMGANRDTVIGDPLIAFEIFGAAAAAVLLSVAVWRGLTRGVPLPIAQRVSLLLFSSYKNQGLAATLALTLFGAQSALPPIMMGIFEIVWISSLLRFLPTARKEAGATPEGRELEA